MPEGTSVVAVSITSQEFAPSGEAAESTFSTVNTHGFDLDAVVGR